MLADKNRCFLCGHDVSDDWDSLGCDASGCELYAHRGCLKVPADEDPDEVGLVLCGCHAPVVAGVQPVSSGDDMEVESRSEEESDSEEDSESEDDW